MKQIESLAGYTGAKGDSYFWMDELAKEVFGDNAKTCEGLIAFAYLYRRFGPPTHGCDDHKEIAAYYLTTDIEGLVLFFTCSASPIKLCFGYMRNSGVLYKLPPRGSEDPNPFQLECRKALMDAMRELLEPVWVRDLPINILGH